MCGGLRGWPITQRSGCAHCDCMRLMGRLHELEAMIESTGCRAVQLRKQPDLEIGALRGAFLNEVRLRHGG